MEVDRYAYYQQIVDRVDAAVSKIKELDYKQCFNSDFLEHEFIPALGLNNELLHEQPKELADFFGKGLHLWQYPSQLSKYLVWLAHNGRQTKKYLEIGCRWGGTFILVSEWLKKIGAPLELCIAVDPVEPTPFVKRYMDISTIPVVYVREFSTSPKFLNYLRLAKPDMVFIDGDHTMRGVMFDHLQVRNQANIIVHHDIHSNSCPDTTLFWQYARQTEGDFEAFEFIDQYPSVAGSFLGIGVLSRISKS